MKEETKQPGKGVALIDICKYIYRFSEGRRPVLFFYVFLFILVNVIDMLDILLIGYLFNYIQLNGVISTNIVFILSLILGLFAIDFASWALHGPARILEQKMAFYVSNNFRDYLYRNTLELPLSFHNEEHSGQIISKISKGVISLDGFTSGSFMIIRAIFTAVAVFVTLFIYDYTFALIGGVCLLVTYGIAYLFEQKINPLRDKINKSDNILSEIVYDTISNITTIKMLSLSGIVSKSLDREVAHKFSSFKRKVVLNEIKWYIPSLIGTLFIVGVLLYYVYSMYVLGTIIMVGSLYTLYGFLSKLKGVLYDAAWLISQIQNNYRDIVNSEALSSHFSEIKKVKYKQIKQVDTIDLRDMHFSYGDTFNLSVDTLQLEKGKSYAFVGESGCGKTTMLKILASLLDADSYALRTNNKTSAINNMKDSVMLIPQEPELFSKTVRENITLGIPFTEKEVDDVLCMVNMKEVVAGLPEKIESKIFEKGVNLSGGQKQRLALARGILFARGKEVLLLDEPTSSVDQENEEEIYQKLLDLSRNKILISSVHKKNLLRFFDYIVYFEQGRIKEVVKNVDREEAMRQPIDQRVTLDEPVPIHLVK